MQNVIGQPQQQPQSVQVPNYSGVNIQIFNPSVAAPGASVPGSVVNTSNYSTAPAAYPPNYYTQNFNPVNNVSNPAQQAALPATAPAAPPAPAPVQAVAEPEKKKTEKREIVQLTDDYVKNVENYLNSQNSDVRLMGAKEVMARLQEDDSRKNDKALNALVNKMLQDPSQKVKFIALALLDSGAASGDTTSVNILQNMQQQKTNYGEDALKASEILLKMSGGKVQKEFEVKDKPKKEEKKQSEKA